ncbi:MAG: GNAT family N-acetyltransferase [Marinoscillum sp.]|uniref:GNAT family N-acetyltransferase n=1 Tax=Marinoscillum sp. TaxID=2024838 RepID=UPI0032FA83D3
MSFLEDHCTLRLLNQELLDTCSPFICDDADLNDFFINDCIAYNNELLGRTYCFTLDTDPSQIVCAFTVSNDSIKARLLPKPSKNRLNRNVNNQKRGLKSYPAVLIGRLGVAQSFEGRGIGKELMDFIKAWFIDGANKTGCRFVVVDAYNQPKVLSYYKKNGYQSLFHSEEEEKEYSAIQSDDQLETRLLFFDLILLIK